MKTAFSAFLAAHGAIHLIGFARAIGYSPIALRGPSSISLGILWLITAVGFFVSARLVVRSSRDWSIPAAPALLLSQLLILICWSDAKWGTVANALILAPVLLSFVVAASALQAREIVRCLRLKMWDPARNEMVGYPTAEETSSTEILS